ncbi:MAG TPA: hypothetical protein VFU21_24040 [Kofleriaceae bacterium]|nr:hypothetical protein [Kofleriaceae bacterium]
MPARRVGPTAVVLAICWLAAAPAEAQPASVAERWLASLHDELAPELAAGGPLVVQVHVPLCDNDVLRCGRGRLGDGDDADGNLYWATSGGFRGWFGRKGSPWRLVHTARAPEEDVVEVRVWLRKVTPGPALRARGVTKPVPVYVVAHAWRGEAIARAMSAYAGDLFGAAPRRIALPGGTVLAAGGAARLVAFVGHNGWMDVADFTWPRASRKAARKATIAVACITEDYLVPAVPHERRVPLLFTRSLLFAGAHAFEGAVSAFAAGETLAGVRESAVRAYAAGQKKPLPRVRAAFTNPADRKWKHR